MEEFKSFDLNAVDKNQEEKNADNQYHSSLGDFSHLQERIIKFGRSKFMLILTILVLTSFVLSFVNMGMLFITDLTFTEGENTQNLNWIKIILVLVIILISIIPIAIVFIRRGAKKLNILNIQKGLDTINVYLNINLVLFIIGAIICGIAMLFLLMRAFIYVVILGILLFGIFSLYFKFISKSKEFIFDISSAFIVKDAERVYPSAVSLRVYFIVFLVFNIINYLINLNESNVALEQLNIEQYDIFSRMDILSNITFVVGLLTSIFVIYVAEKFDDFLLVGKPHEYSYKTFNHDDSEWHL